MPDSVNVDGECNTLCTSLSAVDQQLPIAIGATPVVNQRQHHLVDVPARHGCYHGTRPRTPVGTGKTRLRKIQATERPTHSVPLRAMGRCQCWRSRAAPDLRPCEGYPRRACTGNFLLLHPHMGRIIHSICCHGNFPWNRHRPHVGGAAPGAQAARRGPWAAASAGGQGLPLTSGPARASPAGPAPTTSLKAAEIFKQTGAPARPVRLHKGIHNAQDELRVDNRGHITV